MEATAEEVIEFTHRVDLPNLIADAYINLYDPKDLPLKQKLMSPDNESLVLLMPFIGPDDFFIIKTLVIRKNQVPGITGSIAVHSISDGRQIALIDGTSVTGIRTAAKSLLITQRVFTEAPLGIRIHGASTQAEFHALLFARHYPMSPIHLVARSEESRTRLRKRLAQLKVDSAQVLLSSESLPTADLIISTTNSSESPVDQRSALKARLVIAVGSSTPEVSEVEVSAIGSMALVVDAKVSVEGKGELAIPLKRGLIKPDEISELSAVLKDSSRLRNEARPILFVSKGIAIEDYVIARELIRNLNP